MNWKKRYENQAQWERVRKYYLNDPVVQSFFRIINGDSL